MSDRQSILRALADGLPHSKADLDKAMSRNPDRPKWTTCQRIKELRQSGIDIDSWNEKGKSNSWFYQLVSPAERIDFSKCELKPRSESSSVSLQRQDRNTTGGSNKIMQESLF
jgi:hypothetical protein